MNLITLILMLVAFVSFVIYAVQPAPNKWLGIGLAAWALSILVGGFVSTFHVAQAGLFLPFATPRMRGLFNRKRLGLLLALGASVSMAFAGCVKLGIVPGQAVSATCHLVDGGEKATLLAYANNQLNPAWIKPIKACVRASEVSCVDPLPTSIPADQYTKLQDCIDATNQAKVAGSVPSQAVLDKLK